jgi:glycosyltransferase involved in cell wall biosynthesis
MPPTSIALCITDLDVGGAERCLVELATRIDRNRFSSEVYCLGPRPTDDASSCVAALEEAGIRVHCLGGHRYWHAPSIISQLTRLLAQQSPQILQAFLFHANLLGRIAAWRAGIPCVISGIRVAERHARWHLWADRLTQKMVDRHVCVSHSVARFSVDHARLSADKIVVIPNGIAAEEFPSGQPADLTRLGVPAGHRAITFVGRLTPQKGLRWLIETAPRWLDKLPDCDLLLVGKGPQQSRLERLSAQLGISERVHFAGWQADVPEILAASQLLVLTSRWEGMPNVILQAMATGLPVLATNVEGVVELLGDGAEKQTVTYGNSQLLVERLVAIMSNPGLAAQLANENRIRAANEFTLARMVARYETLWESLVKQ